VVLQLLSFFFSSRRRHTRFSRDWSSDVCSSDLGAKKLDHGKGYVYPHDHPGGVVRQQYAPDTVADRRYYDPTSHGAERQYGEVLERLRGIVRGSAREPGGPEQGETTPK